MVSAAKAFAKEPPKKKLVTLKRVIKDFKWRYQDRDLTDQVVKYCAEATTFEEAVMRAVEARDAGGKHHNHQSKVDITARRKFGRKIVKRRNEIMRMMKHDRKAWDRATDDQKMYLNSPFDSLHDLLDKIKPFGIGPVTVYDVAVRVGAYLRVVPQSVYLHAGVRAGLKALLPDEPDLLKMKRVPLTMLPEPLHDLPADDVEDMLCTYREVFLTWH